MKASRARFEPKPAMERIDFRMSTSNHTIDITERKIAYFSMEIALSKALPTYSGGLGILAGGTLLGSSRTNPLALDDGLAAVLSALICGNSGGRHIIPLTGRFRHKNSPLPAKSARRGLEAAIS